MASENIIMAMVKAGANRQVAFGIVNDMLIFQVQVNSSCTSLQSGVS